MKIEVKNVKFVEALSEEIYCFTASIRVDGKKVVFKTGADTISSTKQM